MQFLSRSALSTFLVLAIAEAAPAEVIGPCKFDTGTMSFAGSPREQTECLLTSVKKYAELGAPLRPLPENLGRLVGEPVQLSADALREHLSTIGLEEVDVGGFLSEPLSQTSEAKKARYLVIHDTSSPYFGERPFSEDIDSDTRINKLSGYGGPNSKAHIFVNRQPVSEPGSMLVGHEFDVPWRATKLELNGAGVRSRGLFLHIELIQPRRRDPAGGPRNDAIAPVPGFSPAQYDKLALLYAAASVRAGSWLVPAFHAVMDHGFSDAHDDPQNFSVDDFDASLGRLLDRLNPT